VRVPVPTASVDERNNAEESFCPVEWGVVAEGLGATATAKAKLKQNYSILYLQ
jgi:hypothetical protein